MKGVNKNDYIMVAGDFHGRVGNQQVANTVGTFGKNTINDNGLRLIEQ